MNDPAPSVQYESGTGYHSLHQKPLNSYTLSDLLKLRKDIVGQKDHFISKYGKQGYASLAGKIQSWIYYRRTHRSSGIIAPYDKDYDGS